MLNHILSVLIFFPILGGALVLATGGEKQARKPKVLSLVIVLLNLALSVVMYAYYNPASHAIFHFEQNIPWFPLLNINYHIGIDGLSLALILLTEFTTLLVVLGTWNSINKRVAQYQAAFLMMLGFMVGVFCALDAILFYVFWEATLIPMFLIIGIWGSTNRVYASIKFFLYTFLGSALFLVALIYLHFKTNSFDLLKFYGVNIPLQAQVWVFLAFFLAFAVKIPMWPVHTWLPDAHTEAPAGGSVILAAIMLKMGAYGFYRLSMPIVPHGCAYLAWWMIGLSLVAIVYIGFVAIIQRDMKRLIAYSSISHMGIVTLGCFMVYIIFQHAGKGAPTTEIALTGSMVQMISHGFTSAAMFLGVGILYDRMHTREIKDFGGIVHRMPIFASFFMLFAMANAGLPGTSGFVGEFMVLLSALRANFWVAFAAGSTLILAAAYTLWMYKRVFFGEIVNEKVAALKEVPGMDMIVLVLLAAAVLFIGVYPQFLVSMLKPAATHLLQLTLVK